MKRLLSFLVLLHLSLFASDDVEIKDNVLHDAVRYQDMDMLKYLLSQDLDKNQKDEFGNTPLHLAVRSDSLEIVEILLDNYVKTDGKNYFGDTPMLIAARNGNNKIAKELACSGAPYDDLDANNISALQYATQNGNLQLAKLLTTPADKLGCSIKLSFNDFSKTKTDEICGKIVRGKADRVIFFILDSDNRALIESSKARILDNGKKWCAKTNAFGSISGNYEIFVNGYGENKKGKLSQKFTAE